ncbi:choice-of-anchor G family protein [Glutamicibacter soli]|uniref:Choice-of-anchor G family protein n=1 Tax=Glutamicibacter soli TaxID=453836 RepID=A0A6L9G3Q1_9MICC|nr:choice-of-anchor G family protein [Glutamicibacter soli]
MADTQATESESAAHGHGIFVEGLGLGVAESAIANSEYPTSTGPIEAPISVELLESLNLNLGELQLPLIKKPGQDTGLLHLGELGALESYATSPNRTESTASSGILGNGGALDLSPSPSESGPAEINLSDLLSQVLSEDLIREVLKDAKITTGAVGSTITEKQGVLDSKYTVADLKANIDSPLVGGLVTDVNSVLETAIEPISGLVSSGGAVEKLVAGVVDAIDAIDVPLVAQTDAKLTSLSLDTEPLLTSVRTQLLSEPLTSTDGSVSVDLDAGTIDVNLAQLVLDVEGKENLNSLDENTKVLSGAVVNRILAGVTDALIGDGPNSLISKVISIATEGIYDLKLDIELAASIKVLGVIELADAPLTVSGTLGGFLGQQNHDAPKIDTSGIEIAGIPVGQIVQPIANLLGDLVSSIGQALTPVVNDVVGGLQPNLTTALEPIVNRLLDDALTPVLTNLLQITINEKPDESDLGADGSTVRALAIDVLPNSLNVGVDLGSSSVKAADTEAAVTISSPTADQKFTNGDPVAVSGKGEPGKTITVTVDGDAGTAKSVVVDANGDWSTSFEGLESGAHTVVATDGDADAESTAEVSFEVQDAAGADSDGADASVDAVSAADANADAQADAVSAADANADAQADAVSAADANADAQADAVSAADANADAQADAASAADAETGADSAGADSSVEANVDGNVDAEAGAEADAASAADAEAGADTAGADANADAQADAASAADAEAGADTAGADANADAQADAASAADAEAGADTAGADANADAQADAASAADAEADADTAGADANADAQTDAASAADANADAEAGADTAGAQADAASAADANADAEAGADTAGAQADAVSAADANADAQADAASAADAETGADSAGADANADAQADAASAADANADANADSAGADAQADAASAADANSDAQSEADGDTDGNYEPVGITSPKENSEVEGPSIVISGVSDPNAKVTVTVARVSEGAAATAALTDPQQQIDADDQGNWSVTVAGVEAGKYTAHAADGRTEDTTTFVVYDPSAESDSDSSATEGGSDSSATEGGSDSSATEGASDSSSTEANASADGKDNGSSSKHDSDGKKDELADTGANGVLIAAGAALMLALAGAGILFARRKKA